MSARGPSAVELNGKQRASYWFNPHAAYYLDINAPGPVTSRYKKLSDYSDTKRATKHQKSAVRTVPRALVADFFYDVGSMSHNNDRKHEMGLNMAFADGHVASQFNTAAWGRLTSASGGNTNWDWVRVNDVIGMFEYQADNKPLNLGNGGSNFSNKCSNYDPYEPAVTTW